MDWVARIWAEIGEMRFHWPPTLASLLAWFGFLAGLAVVVKAARVSYTVVTMGLLLGWKTPRALYRFSEEIAATRMAIAMFKDGPPRARQFMMSAIARFALVVAGTALMGIITLQPATQDWARIPMLLVTMLNLVGIKRYGRRYTLAFRRAADLASPGARVEKLGAAIQELEGKMPKGGALQWPMSLVFQRLEKATKEHIEVCREYLRLAHKQLDDVTRPAPAPILDNPLTAHFRGGLTQIDRDEGLTERE